MPTPRAPLTRRESEVLRLAAEGYPTREIRRRTARGGKVQKYVLREREWQGLERRIN